MASDLLKELPSFNEQNFSKFKADSTVKCSHHRPIVYLPTKDTSDQDLEICLWCKQTRNDRVLDFNCSQVDCSAHTQNGPQTNVKCQTPAVIVTDKANILLRCLHQQWENKQQRKRESTRASSPPTDYKSSKIPRRMDPGE